MISHKETIKTTMTSITLFLYILFTGCANNQSLSNSETAIYGELLKNFANSAQWKETIQKFKEDDQKNPPPQNAVLFVGSSSIVGWDTKKWFPDIKNINRGFGGSQINDSWYYAEDIIIPYHPKTIIFYAGDNDATIGQTPEMIFISFKAFAVKVRKALPKTKLIYISIKPSIARWAIWPKMQEANRLISNYCDKQKNMYFIDVSKVMLDASGKPIEEIFSNDGLHMNEKGYQQWIPLVRSFIDK